MQLLRYTPTLNPLTGGINSTLLMLQLEYWFTRTNGKPFYKFLEPCHAPECKPGDTWAEELGFTKAEFRNAFSKIGTVYKSKKAYLESTDKFQGKFYLSYYDRIKRLTYYIRNEQLVESTLISLHIPEQFTSTNAQTASPLSLDYTARLPKESSLERHATPTLPVEPLESIPPTEPAPSIETIEPPEDQAPLETILTLYHTTCPSLDPVPELTPSIATKLQELWQATQQSLTTLGTIFEKVEASDFLSGRLKNKSFKASFEWIIKGTKYLDILKDKYKNRYQELQKTQSTKPTRFTNIATHNWDMNQLEALEQAYIEENLEKNKNLTSPLLARLSAYSQWSS